jgi:hypothetical protein
MVKIRTIKEAIYANEQNLQKSHLIGFYSQTKVLSTPRFSPRFTFFSGHKMTLSRRKEAGPLQLRALRGACRAAPL